MPQRNDTDPNKYWERDQKAKSQRLYVAFCEFAASFLDYGTGRDLLLRGAQNAGRLNWASTAFYYSLVHAGRFLIFVPIGDFPTKHGDLAQCFRQDGEGKPTDWLNGFAEQIAANQRQTADRYRKRIHFQDICAYWVEKVEVPQAQEFLTTFGKKLARAKELRNENNYEALLIAHEYRHFRMTESFRNLAKAMRQVARSALEVTPRWFSSYLRCDIDDPWEWNGSAKLSFVRRYADRRILKPAKDWYQLEDIAKEIREMLKPILEVDASNDNALADQIENDVKFDVFQGKESLMSDFESKIGKLT